MPEVFSHFVIDALVEVISGGGGYDTDAPIGVYRTAPEIESFLRSCGMEIFEGSRRKALALALSLGTAAAQRRIT